MVGTKPMRLPVRCHCLVGRCIAAMEVTIRMVKKCGSGGGQSIQLSNGISWQIPQPLLGRNLCSQQNQFYQSSIRGGIFRCRPDGAYYIIQERSTKIPLLAELLLRPSFP